MSGSGSGGHIYPCIATYNYLKKNHNLTIIVFKEIDKKIYDLNKINYEFISDELSSIKKISKIKKIYKNKNVEKSLTFGGKNSIFINLVSKIMHVDCFIFEQNAIMGKANKINSFFAKKIFTNFLLNHKKEINVGNPNAFNIKKTCKNKIFKNKRITILFTMGSLGSSSVNNVIEKYIKNNMEYNIIYVTGNNVKSKILDSEFVKTFPFYNPLSELLVQSDIVVSRAGASTLSEIIALNKVSIIIPSPYVANNHQYKNAKILYDNKACELILEKNLTYGNLANKIRNLTHNNKNYQTISYNLAKFETKNNFDLIESEIIK